jgi:hypothetical protein
MTRRPSWFCALAAAAVSIHCGSDQPATGLDAGGQGLTGGSATSAGGSSSGGSASQAGGAVVSPSAGGGALPTAGAGGQGGSAPSQGGSGGSGQGGSSGGAASGSGGSGGSVNPSGCDGHLLCEDFESYAVGSPPGGQWTITKNGTGTSLVVDSLQKKSGMKAAHFSGSLNNSNSLHMSAQGAPVFPVPGDSLFVRYMMFVQTYPGSKNEEMHTRLVWVGFQGMVLNTSAGGINTNNNKVYAMETYNGIGVERLSSGHYRDTSMRMPQAPNVGQWVCWEFEVDNKGGPPAGVSGGALTHVWREGSELKLSVKGGEGETWGPVPFEMLNFSFFSYQTASEPSDFWLDDLAMDTKRIGCPM